MTVKYDFSKSEVRACVQESRAIFERQRQELLRVRDDITLPHPRRFTSESLAKFYLVNCMQLSGQILRASESGMTLLAYIGYRALLEHYINVKYTFAHPEHKGDSAWAERIAKDFWQRTKYDTHKKKVLLKNNLDDKTVAKRASEVRMKLLYKKTYAKVSAYTHNLGTSSVLNKESVFHAKTVEVNINTLSAVNNIIEFIAKVYDAKHYGGTEEDIRSLIARYKKLGLVS